MSEKPATIQLLLKLGNEELLIASLRFKKRESELVYQFGTPNDFQGKTVLLDTGIIQDRIDHPTWHVNGWAHCVLDDMTTHLFRTGFSDNQFLPSGNSDISPLLIHNIPLNNAVFPLKKYERKKNALPTFEQTIVQMDVAKEFVVSLFLVPHIYTTEEFFNGFWRDYKDRSSGNIVRRVYLSELRAKQFGHGRIEAWNGWDIVS